MGTVRPSLKRRVRTAVGRWCRARRRAHLPAREDHARVPRCRPPSGRDATPGFRASLSGTRPVLKSTTETSPSSTSKRSTVPAMTRPSGRVAASGASPSEPGPNRPAKRGSDRIPQTWSAISAAAPGRQSPRPAQARRALLPGAHPARHRQGARANGGSRSRDGGGAHRRARRRRGRIVGGDRRRGKRPWRARFRSAPAAAPNRAPGSRWRARAAPLASPPSETLARVAHHALPDRILRRASAKRRRVPRSTRWYQLFSGMPRDG